MAFTDINSEDRLVQQTFADHLHQVLGWDSVYAWNQQTFGPDGTLGRLDQKEIVLTRDLRAALTRLNPELPEKAVDDAIETLTRQDFSRSTLQHNQAFYGYIRDGVPVSYRDAKGQLCHARARVIDFRDPTNNRVLCVRELTITGLRTPNYNRRADLVCFVNGLPLVFIELKAVYKNIRAGFDGNLRDYMDEHVVAHHFHDNAFLIVSNGDRARYGSITSQWEHFAEWKRQDERDKGSVDAEALLNGMLAKVRLLDIVEHFILFDANKPAATRKIVARNHQMLGVNRAVDSVVRQEAFIRFKALLMEPTALAYAERHDNIEAVYKKLTERRDKADVTELLKALHRIVNEAIRAQESGDDQAEGLTFDLSRIDLEQLRDEFAKKVRRKATALQDILDIVEQRLAEMLKRNPREMLKRNPRRMDYYKRYQEIIADYNREKDRTTIEATFAKLAELVENLDEEQGRAAEEGLDEDELALFDLLTKDKLGNAEREKVKQASQALLASLRELLAPLERWTEKEQTRAEVETFILDQLYVQLPAAVFTDEEKQLLANGVYQHVWQQSVSGGFLSAGD